MITFKRPLQYPLNWPRTPRHKVRVARFSEKPIEQAIRELGWELGRLKATSIVFTSNLDWTSGPHGTLCFSETSRETGVAVYFTLQGRQQVLACDKWYRAADNIWAVYRHVDAMRGLDRWGVGSIAQAFAGYAALPAPPAPKTCFEILGVAASATAEEIKAAFRSLAKEKHPDGGGTNAEMVTVLDAYKEALRRVGVTNGGGL
jgi:hypothetical protein